MSYNIFFIAHKTFLTILNIVFIAKSLFEALGHGKWREAMRVEMDTLEKNVTWDLVELSREERLQWVVDECP
uniref:Uncharacterized protein n=1 Tax=Rhizophora mucronata TaxID=61149 RepID=A0A2P2N2N6_RHIMU